MVPGSYGVFLLNVLQVRESWSGHQWSEALVRTVLDTTSVSLAQGCRCDANVEALAQGLGIQPSGFFTLGRAGRSSTCLPLMAQEHLVTPLLMRETASVVHQVLEKSITGAAYVSAGL